MAGGGSRAPGLAAPSSPFPHSGDAPWARRHPPSMAGGGSRGIHAARPTPRRLRSACTQVAFCGVWAMAYEDQDQDQDQRQRQRQRQSPRAVNAEPVAVRLAGGSDLPYATAGKPDGYRVRGVLGVKFTTKLHGRSRIRSGR
ncbi:hypothetical protein BWR59_21190 [Pseudomonas sp. Bc-h]|nr:hypothetical protein BWR59_21190 [Pseudomonas sp. Bc-h]